MSASSILRTLVWSDMTETDKVSLVDRDLDRSIPTSLRDQISALIEDVRHRGDAAVCDALRTFDKVDVTPADLRVGNAEWDAAPDKVEPQVREAITDMIVHIKRFNEELMSRLCNWEFESEPGLRIGERVTPIASAGLFCPSGKASYPSVLAQLGGPAVVAGVPQVAVVVPPKPGGGGEVDPSVLMVARELGVREVFRVNGPAGIAALAFGTETIPRVVKIMGPGSLPVTVAQLEVQRFGTAVHLALGPTESVVIADDSADPDVLALDLMTEAEHGTDSCTVFITPSRELARATEERLRTHVAGLPAERADAVRSSLGVNGGCVLVDDLVEAADVANRFAPEHLQLVVDASLEQQTLELLIHAGEILIGQSTPFAAANFLIGCPASLPTNGFARVNGGVTVDAFLKRTAVARASRSALERLSPSIVALADAEGFSAHGNALRNRYLESS
jgi:histidinol dehydrogenase